MESATTTSMFDVSTHGRTVIVTPTVNLGSLDFEQIKDNGAHVLHALKHSDARNVIVDFGRINYFSSSAIAFFGRIWATVSKRGGKMAVCNLCDEGKDLLRITKLDTLWSVCPSLEDALDVVGDR